MIEYILEAHKLMKEFSFTATGGMAIGILLLALSGLISAVAHLWSMLK